MLDDLERGVTASDSKLNTAMAKMRKFIRQTEGAHYCSSAPSRTYIVVDRDEVGLVYRHSHHHPHGVAARCDSRMTSQPCLQVSLSIPRHYCTRRILLSNTPFGLV